MNYTIATDVPKWLKDIINKIKWNEFNALTKMFIKNNVSAECAKLIQKKAGYNVYSFTTDAPEDILAVINKVDFTRMSPGDQENFKQKIESNIRNYLGVS